MNANTEFEIIPGYEHAELLGELFSEYTAMLVEGAPDFAGYLRQQRYDEELKELKERYGTPRGRLFIAMHEGRAAGCIAMKPFSEDACELKRLYVRPEYRRSGLARRLCGLVIAAAREEGYSRILLDTMPWLREAITLYRSLGFYDIEKYNDCPMEEFIYLRLDLQ